MALLGQPTFWLTQDPENVRIIFTSSPDNFNSSAHNPVGPLLGEAGLIMQSGNEHSHNRKSFSSFFSRKSLENFELDIEEIFNEITTKIDISKTFHLQKFSQNITLKIIIRFLFPNAPKHMQKRLEELVPCFCMSYLPFFVLIPTWMSFVWNSFLQKREKLDQCLYECYQIELNQTENSIHKNLKYKDKREILDQLRTFIIAGHETSAVSLTWSLFYLAKDINIYHGLSSSMNQNSKVQSYVKEILRLKPPVPFIMRKLNRGLLLADAKNFSNNDEIGVSISLLHKNPCYWKNPHQLMINRFELPIKSSFAYAPYGGGNRKCLGSALADMELSTIITLFLRKFRCTLHTNAIVKSEILQITLGPKKPIYLRLENNDSH